MVATRRGDQGPLIPPTEQRQANRNGRGVEEQPRVQEVENPAPEMNVQQVWVELQRNLA